MSDFLDIHTTPKPALRDMIDAASRMKAARGDVPALRQAAQTAVPVVQAHLGEAQQMMGTLR